MWISGYRTALTGLDADDIVITTALVLLYISLDSLVSSETINVWISEM